MPHSDERRKAYARGVELIRVKQKELGSPPKRKLVPSLAHEIVKEAGLRHDARERYFELLAKCALLGLEPMYNNYKSLRRKK